MLSAVAVTNLSDDVNAPDLTSIAALQGSNGGDGISLREAVLAANADTLDAIDTITFSPTATTFLNGQLVSLNGQHILLDGLNKGELVITTNITIDATNLPLGIKLAVVDPTAQPTGTGTRLLNIVDLTAGANPPQVDVKRVEFTGGDADEGGAIKSTGILKLDTCRFVENQAFERGGALFVRVANGPTADRTVLQVINCWFADNQAMQGGAISIESGDSGDSSTDLLFISGTTIRENFTTTYQEVGGGLEATLFGATLTISNSVVAANQSEFGGGVHATLGGGAELNIEKSTFDRNQNLAFDANDGAGVYAELSNAALNITDSTFTLNKTLVSGGAVFAKVHDDGVVTISRSTFDRNEAHGRGDAGGGAIVGEMYEGGTLQVLDSKLVDNIANLGGAVLTLPAGSDTHGVAPGSLFLMQRTRVESNRASSRGGGIFLAVGAAGEARIEESIITGNDAGIELPTGGGDVANSGGGVYAILYTQGGVARPTLTLSGSLFDTNVAGVKGGGLAIYSKGFGGIGIPPTPQVGIYNSTFSGNRAGMTRLTNPGPIPGAGGGVWLGVPDEGSDTLDVVVTNATVTKNIADEGGGIYSVRPALSSTAVLNAKVNNSIVSGNRQHYIDPNNPVDVPSNMHGSFNILDTVFNIIGSGSTTFDHDDVDRNLLALRNDANSGNIFTDNPRLAALADNGGPTRTHRPLPASGPDPVSPAIDAALNTLALVPFTSTPLPTDQRGVGFTRNYNTPGVNSDPARTVDIGAYEVQLPKVIDVIIGSSIASETYHPDYKFSEARFQGERVIGTGAQLRTVPVAQADTIEIRFSEPVNPANLTVNSLSVKGLRFGSNPVPDANTPFTSAADGQGAKWKFSAALAADQYAIKVLDSVTDLFGQGLDGEWVNPDRLFQTSAANSDVFRSDVIYEFPSGDGNANLTAGAENFVFVATILPGDATRDNWVNVFDFSTLSAHYNASGWTFEDGDFNGDSAGMVNVQDFSILNANYNKNLQSLWQIADVNSDGVVDGADSAIIAGISSLNLTSATFAQGDVNGDGRVDAADFARWQRTVGIRWVWV